jgi:hypothetical protein
VIPGHGTSLRGSGARGVPRYGDDHPADRVRDMIKRGMTLEQIKTANPTQGYRSRYGADAGPWTTSMFVEAVYRSLDGRRHAVRRGILAPTLVVAVLVLRGRAQPGGTALRSGSAPVARLRVAPCGRAAPASPPTARATAPIDLTGNWVSIITEDWRWRMVTPAKGDYASVPITAEAKRIADAWNPAKDQSGRRAMQVVRRCGNHASANPPSESAGSMTTSLKWKPMRARRRVCFVSERPNHLRVFPPGRDTRSQSGKLPEAGGPAPEARAARSKPTFGDLKVVYHAHAPGYLRKNGIPYSADAVLTEYWDVNREPNGDLWLVVTSLVDDPKWICMHAVCDVGRISRKNATDPNGSRHHVQRPGKALLDRPSHPVDGHVSVPADAQKSTLSGNWVSRQHEDWEERGPARKWSTTSACRSTRKPATRALAYSASMAVAPGAPVPVLPAPLRRARSAGLRIWSDTDPVTGREVAWNIMCRDRPLDHHDLDGWASASSSRRPSSPEADSRPASG